MLEFEPPGQHTGLPHSSMGNSAELWSRSVTVAPDGLLSKHFSTAAASWLTTVLKAPMVSKLAEMPHTSHVGVGARKTKTKTEAENLAKSRTTGSVA
jgi:hypothetical protein